MNTNYYHNNSLDVSYQQNLLNKISNNNIIVDIPSRYANEDSNKHLYSLFDTQKILNDIDNRNEIFLPNNNNLINFIIYSKPFDISNTTYIKNTIVLRKNTNINIDLSNNFIKNILINNISYFNLNRNEGSVLKEAIIKQTSDSSANRILYKSYIDSSNQIINKILSVNNINDISFSNLNNLFPDISNNTTKLYIQNNESLLNNNIKFYTEFKNKVSQTIKVPNRGIESLNINNTDILTQIHSINFNTTNLLDTLYDESDNLIYNTYFGEKSWFLPNKKIIGNQGFDIMDITLEANTKGVFEYKYYINNQQNDNNILDISNVPYTVFFNISGGKIYIDEEYPNLIINDISENSTTTNLNTIYNNINDLSNIIVNNKFQNVIIDDMSYNILLEYNGNLEIVSKFATLYFKNEDYYFISQIDYSNNRISYYFWNNGIDFSDNININNLNPNKSYCIIPLNNKFYNSNFNDNINVLENFFTHLELFLYKNYKYISGSIAITNNYIISENNITVPQIVNIKNNSHLNLLKSYDNEIINYNTLIISGNNELIPVLNSEKEFELINLNNLDASYIICDISFIPNIERVFIKTDLSINLFNSFGTNNYIRELNLLEMPNLSIDENSNLFASNLYYIILNNINLNNIESSILNSLTINSNNFKCILFDDGIVGNINDSSYNNISVLSYPYNKLFYTNNDVFDN